MCYLHINIIDYNKWLSSHNKNAREVFIKNMSNVKQVYEVHCNVTRIRIRLMIISFAENSVARTSRTRKSIELCDYGDGCCSNA